MTSVSFMLMGPGKGKGSEKEAVRERKGTNETQI